MRPLFDIIDRMERDGRSTRRTQPAVKRIRDTTLEAFREVVTTLAFRERAALVGLTNYIAMNHAFPTAYELYEYMKAKGDAFDINSVRPRLTGLCDRGAVVMNEQKRKCTVSGKSAHTWRLPHFVTVNWMTGDVKYS